MSRTPIRKAVVQLTGSERGKTALENVEKLLKEGATDLDPKNKDAILKLITMAWDGMAGTVLTEIHLATQHTRMDFRR